MDGNARLLKRYRKIFCTLFCIKCWYTIVEWIGGGFSRFYQSLDKVKVPERLGFVPIPIVGGMEVIDPKYLNMFSLGNISQLRDLKNMFFQGDSKESQLLEIPQPEPREILRYLRPCILILKCKFSGASWSYGHCPYRKLTIYWYW